MTDRERSAIVAVVSLAWVSMNASADEGGVSFWLPGQFASFAGTPGEPGFSFPLVYYHAFADAADRGTSSLSLGWAVATRAFARSK
jgi:hypothetical protein